MLEGKEVLKTGKVSGLFFRSSPWSQGRVEVELLCDALNPGLVAKRCASVDAGTHCVPFRGGQWLVDPLGPAEKAGHRPGVSRSGSRLGLCMRRLTEPDCQSSAR